MYINQRILKSESGYQTMGNHFGENFSILPKVQRFPTSVEHFHEIATNRLNTLTQLAKAYLHENVLFFLHAYHHRW